jgi:large subunit ribosomal protein L29
MKIKDIKEKSDDVLKADLADRRKHLFDLRSQGVTEKLEDPTQLGKTRKDVARLLTVIRQRQIEKDAGNPKAGSKKAIKRRAAKAAKKTA